MESWLFWELRLWFLSTKSSGLSIDYVDYNVIFIRNANLTLTVTRSDI